jgi:hypothetical protein
VRGDELYERKKAWSSVNHSIPCVNLLLHSAMIVCPRVVRLKSAVIVLSIYFYTLQKSCFPPVFTLCRNHASHLFLHSTTYSAAHMLLHSTVTVLLTCLLHSAVIVLPTCCYTLHWLCCPPVVTLCRNCAAHLLLNSAVTVLPTRVTLCSDCAAYLMYTLCIGCAAHPLLHSAVTVLPTCCYTLQ